MCSMRDRRSRGCTSRATQGTSGWSIQGELRGRARRTGTHRQRLAVVRRRGAEYVDRGQAGEFAPIMPRRRRGGEYDLLGSIRMVHGARTRGWVLRLAFGGVLSLFGLVGTAGYAFGQDAPKDARYAASSRGSVYYWIGCDAWRRLAPENLVFFRSADDAERAGYRPSSARGCGKRDEGSVAPVAPPPASMERLSASDLAKLPVCTIARIVDGDTVECRGGERVRLLLIDTPERGQKPYGERATQALSALLPVGTEARIELDVQERDRYGRVLGYLYTPDGIMANEAMVRQGYAVVSVYPPNVRHVERIRAAAEAARRDRAGLWETPAFECLPSDYRRGRC